MMEAQGIILFQEYTLPINSYAQQALLALMSCSNKLEMTFNFLAVISRLGEEYLTVPLKL